MSRAEPTAGMQRLQSRVDSHLEVIYGERAKSLVEPVIEAMRYVDDIEEPAPYQNYWDESDLSSLAFR